LSQVKKKHTNIAGETDFYRRAVAAHRKPNNDQCILALAKLAQTKAALGCKVLKAKWEKTFDTIFFCLFVFLFSCMLVFARLLCSMSQKEHNDTHHKDA